LKPLSIADNFALLTDAMRQPTDKIYHVSKAVLIPVAFQTNSSCKKDSGGFHGSSY
jgi:hypothetical protein